jgi:HSP20 family protein
MASRLAQSVPRPLILNHQSRLVLPGVKGVTNMALVFADPFSTLFRFQEALDQLRASRWLDPGPSAGGAYPPINVFRQNGELVMIAEVPGVKKSDLRIEVKGKTIRIAGSKTHDANQKDDKRKSVHRRERQAGTFDRAVSLPVEIDADKVKAEYRDGILALRLPRAGHEMPKSISIS